VRLLSPVDRRTRCVRDDFSLLGFDRHVRVGFTNANFERDRRDDDLCQTIVDATKRLRHLAHDTRAANPFAATHFFFESNESHVRVAASQFRVGIHSDSCLESFVLRNGVDPLMQGRCLFSSPRGNFYRATPKIFLHWVTKRYLAEEHQIIDGGHRRRAAG